MLQHPPPMNEFPCQRQKRGKNLGFLLAAEQIRFPIKTTHSCFVALVIQSHALADSIYLARHTLGRNIHPLFQLLLNKQPFFAR
jgi:hypothetical protein